VLLVASALAGSLTLGEAQSGILVGPPGTRGEALFPAVEGWFKNPDGSAGLLIGYFNRNKEQLLDVPIGPSNRIEPGGPDQGQPTHFLTGRNWGVFAITVPKDFGTKKLIWTLVANGHTSEVNLWLNPRYFLDPLVNRASGNTPPVIRFSPEAPGLQGPPRGFARTLAGTVGQPVALTLWATDKPATYDGAADGRSAPPPSGPASTAPPPTSAAAAQPSAPAGSPVTAPGGRGGRGGRGGEPRPDVNIVWAKYRGPGDVTFAQREVGVFQAKDTKAETTAMFSAPGEYVLLATANDQSGVGGGGDQCCWTTAHVKVSIK
jgi:hypothetical protein